MLHFGFSWPRLTCENLALISQDSVIGHDPGNRYNLKELIGKDCEVFISYKQADTGDVYERIKDVRALSA